ncbi:hypothetical protein F0562_003977 [Nyssa sinensis]|uniref:Uncharacterized protein n=1 Tax=Nyssa sinensis TaxID=561372 RepID=A0A5J5BXC4_9ASTE|nr:hypothetical protein F0562_003977 [Nyssa sinensis]
MLYVEPMATHLHCCLAEPSICSFSFVGGCPLTTRKTRGRRKKSLKKQEEREDRGAIKQKKPYLTGNTTKTPNHCEGGWWGVLGWIALHIHFGC